MKTVQEWSNAFDIYFNNISSNLAPGLSEYEKSVFLTRAQDELVLNYFNPKSKGNTVGEGFDDSSIRQMDFSTLLRSVEISASVKKAPIIDPRAIVFEIPSSENVFIIINENLFYKKNITKENEVTYWIWNEADKKWQISETIGSIKGELDDVTKLPVSGTEGDCYKVTTLIKEKWETLSTRQIVPVSKMEYIRLMSRPYKEPLKWQAWRLLENEKQVEIVINSQDKSIFTDTESAKWEYRYNLNYVKRPSPIILGDLSNFGNDIKINGKSTPSVGELPEIMHESILQRAVELAKISWEVDANQAQLQTNFGQRSE